MSKIWYGAGISLNQTIGFTAPAPLDNRGTVDEVDALNLITNPYIGLMTYVMSEQIYYVYHGSDIGWKKFVSGNTYTVETTADLETLIKDTSLVNGSIAYVDSLSMYFSFNATDKKWTPMQSSIPIYDANTIDQIGDKYLPDEYIHVPTVNDLNGQTAQSNLSNTYMVYTKASGSYLESIFSTIRILQAEVAKLKNSFVYGINSYTGKDTAMSGIVDSYNEPDDEPLWAVEESDLSGLLSVGINNMTEIKSPNEGGVISINDKYLLLDSSAYWNDDEGALRNASDGSKISDSKLFMYLSISNGIKVNIHLLDLNYAEENSLVDYSTYVDISSVLQEYSAEAYNVLTVISRKVATSIDISTGEKTYAGNNFIWMSVGDAITGLTLGEGYYQSGKLSNNLYTVPCRYCFDHVNFETDNLHLSKLNFYSKYQDFSHEVIPSKPDDESYKYKVSHITIRSVEDYDTLTEIKTQLPENELIFEEKRKKLWIKNNDQLIAIGSSDSSSGDTMTKEQLIALLKEIGIVYDTSTGDYYMDNLTLEQLTLGDIKFIDQASGKTFIYNTDAYGNLVSKEVPDASILLTSRIEADAKINAFPADNDLISNHGFAGNLGLREYKSKYGTDPTEANDLKLLADRIRISAVYAPLKTDTIHGCTHGFIELENTSDIDFDLTDCYLHYVEIKQATGFSETDILQLEHLSLSGVIKAGSTFLVRCKQYANANDANTFINVSTYDQEWYVANDEGSTSLLDISASTSYCYGIALTHNDAELDPTTSLWIASTQDNIQEIISSGANPYFNAGTSYNSKRPYLLKSTFIDAIQYGKLFCDNSGKGYWAKDSYDLASNSMIRLMFALDPAKQAFNATTTHESSRTRWEKKGTDIWTLDMSKEYITFPHTDEVKYISDFSPKASFENKNVITGKTDINKERPNMVTVSFGINMYKTRCFNWISGGLFDEYVWIRKQGESTWSQAFQSYKSISSEAGLTKMASTFPRRYEYNYVDGIVDSSENAININNSIYARITDRFPGCNTLFTSHKCIIDVVENNVESPTTYEYIVGRADKNLKPDSLHISDIQTFTLYPDSYIPQVYQTTDQQGFHWVEYQVWSAVANKINDQIEFDKNYTLKTITIDSEYVKNSSMVGDPLYNITDSYVKPSGCYKINSITTDSSIALEFDVTLDGITTHYTIDNATEIYQTTHIKNKGTEKSPNYVLIDSNKKEVSGATVVCTNADKYNPTYTLSYYVNEVQNIIPVLLNSGDMTQNGTRINEWLDYYNGGYNLFNHLEQMYVVGNNDLCDTDPNILGTGDDSGKSNSRFFHLFYCYQVDASEKICPLVKGLDNVVRYIPSLYYFESVSYRFIMVNSELTETTCKNWFKLYDTSGHAINLYTGYSIESTPQYYADSLGFTTIYTMIYNILNKKDKKVIAVCHEMPYTVITHSSITKSQTNYEGFRSVSGTSLIGSHLNQISTNDSVGIYWFSRLLEYFNVKLCIGGHKHTYTCTYPIREYFYWSGGDKNSLDNYDDYTMEETLKDEAIIWKHKLNRLQSIYDAEVNLTKFPIVISTDFGVDGAEGGENIFYPYTPITSSSNDHMVLYFMCQASGYKLTSNKELPTANQKFAQFLPKTTIKDGTDTASAEQKYPMFARINLYDNDKAYIQLIRVDGIMKSGKFTQSTYLTKEVSLQYFKAQPTDHYTIIKNAYGHWVEYENNLFDTKL